MQLLKFIAFSFASASLALAAANGSLSTIVKQIEQDTHKLTAAVQKLNAKQLSTATQLAGPTQDLVYSLGNGTADFKAHKGKIPKKQSALLTTRVKKIAKDVKTSTDKIAKESKQIKKGSAKVASEIADSLDGIGKLYAAFGKAFESKVDKSDAKKAKKFFGIIEKGFSKVAKAFKATAQKLAALASA